MEEIFDKINAMMDDELYRDVIELISDFLDSNPQYHEDNLLSFSNPIEKALYEKYFGPADNCIEFNVHELYIFQGFCFFNLFDYDHAEKFLKTAIKVNPVSSDAWFILSNIYEKNRDMDKFKQAIDNVFRYNYYQDIMISNYRNLSKYYAYCGDIKQFFTLSNFASNLDSDDVDIEKMELSVIEMAKSDIQMGFNLEIIELAARIKTESNLANEEDKNFIEAIYLGLADFNSYIRGLCIDVNLDGITEEVKIDIVNNNIDEAISKISEFFKNDTLDESLNCKIFNNEIERDLYHSNPDFDHNYVLLPKHKNYHYLHYLNGFVLEKQEKYDEACKAYQKALDFNPYSIFTNISLLKLKLNLYMPTKLCELTNLADMCYTKDDLLKVYECYILYLKTHKRWDDVDGVDMFITYLKISDYKAIASRTIEMLKKDGFNILFTDGIIKTLEHTIKHYSEKELDNLDLYKGYLDDILEFNTNLEAFLDVEVTAAKMGILKDFSENELNGSYVLIHEKLSEIHYPRIQFLRADFNEADFDSSDSFVCYAYKQVTGSLAFLFLSVSSNGEELTIYDRNYFTDIVLRKNILNDSTVTILNELSQFTHYVNETDNYAKWLGRNLSGDKDIDRKFLLEELKSIDDDLFGLKKDAIGKNLREVIDLKDLLKKEIPSGELIANVRKSISESDHKRGLIMIENFLNEYPMLYSDGYMDGYFYFTDAEVGLYKKYTETSKRIIRLPESQNYCEIYNLKAEILIYYGKYDDAVGCLEEARDLNPLNVRSQILMSEAFLGDGDEECALKLLKNALIFNTDIEVHSDIYERMGKIYSDLGEDALSLELLHLSEMFTQSRFDGDIKKDMIVDEEILVGFNPDVLGENQALIKINEKLFNGTVIDNVLQAAKPLLGKWPKKASEKLKRFIVDNNVFDGYEIPYDKFEMSLMHGDETDGDRFYNFENEIHRQVFGMINPQNDTLQMISDNLNVCELLNTYAYSLKNFQVGKAIIILEESLKLNPVNLKTLSYIIEMHLKAQWLDEAKPYFDELFAICWDKKILVGAYENLSEYYRYRGLKDISKFIEEFGESLKNETFENNDHIELFKKHDIPLGFNENMIEIMALINSEIYGEMQRINEMLMPL